MARYALVTGVGGDIGRAICAAMAADGSGRFISDQPAQERGLQVTSEACDPSGVEIALALFDVTDADAVAASVDMLAARHGAPTAVVANAGIQGDFAPVHENDAGVARRALDVNVVAEREAEGCLLPHSEEGGMGTGRDLRRGPGRRDRGTEGSGRRRDGPGPRRARLRQVADPPGPRRRIPAHDGPDCDRRGAQPIRRAGRAPEARRRRRATLPERSSPQILVPKH